MDPLLLGASPEVLEKLHWSSYDLTTLHEYSDLDQERWDVTLRAEARITDHLTGTVGWEIVEVDDASPYLADLGGRLDTLRVGLRWLF